MKPISVSDEIHKWIMNQKTSELKSADLVFRQIKKELEEIKKELEEIKKGE